MKNLLLFLLIACALHADTTVTGAVGARLDLAVAVGSGTPPFTYQWRKNGVDIVGATAPTYTIPAMTATDFGEYTCVVANVVAKTISDRGIVVRVTAAGGVTVKPVVTPPLASPK